MKDVSVDDGDLADFDVFARVDGARLRRVLSTQYGPDIGCEATDEALAWGWERWSRIGAMANPAGYLYRVAQTRANSVLRNQPVRLPPEGDLPRSSRADDADHDLANRGAHSRDLGAALERLSFDQRLAVLMVHAYGWTPAELATLTGTPASTIRSHLHRGLRQLRRHLEEAR